MFKWTGKGGFRRAGSRGISRVARVSSKQMGHVTTNPPPHTAFLDPPGSGNHGFDSNSPRISEISGGR